MLLEGIFVPLTTPFYPDGRLYLRKLEHNVDRISRTPAAGMVVLGEAGEAAGLTDEETRSALTAAIEAAAKHKVMIASIGRESVFATLELARHAASVSYDCIAVRPPEFSLDGALRRELMTYFRAIADQSPLPLILISEQLRQLSVDTLAELAEHPNVIGAIDEQASSPRLTDLLQLTAKITRQVTVTTIFQAATGRMLRAVEPAGKADFVSADSLSGQAGGGIALAVQAAAPAIKTRAKTVGFQVLSANSARMLASWQAGANGSVPRLAACAPQGCCEVWQAFKDGDQALAEEKQARVALAAERMEGFGGVAAIKHGCDLNGYYGGRPRLPLIALNQAEQEEVELMLGGMRN